MKVKDLRRLVNEVPSELSQEEFDNLEITVWSEEGSSLSIASEDTSGYIVFGGRCDEKGDPIGEDWEDEKYNHGVFLIE